MRRSLVLLALALHPGAALPAPSFTSLGPLTFASDVSGDGSVVTGVIGGRTAVRWTAGEIEYLGTLPGAAEFGASPVGISDDGTTVVGISGGKAFRWQAGVMVGLGTLPGTGYSAAYGVSADGAVVVGVAEGSVSQAFRWTEASGLVGLGDFPGGFAYSTARNVSADGDIVVGFGSSSDAQEAFRWTEASGMIGLGDLDGGLDASVANAISTDEIWVVGTSSTASGAEAMRWSEATGMLPLGVLPGTFESEALDVSGDGSLVVGSSLGVAFLWDEQHGMRDLKEVLVQDFGLNLTGWSLEVATGISADGRTIVGQGRGPESAITQAWVAVIPEPSTAALLALGLAVFGLRHRG